MTHPPSTLPLRFITKDQKNTQIPHSPPPPFLPLYHLFFYFWCYKKIKNQSYSPTHGTSIHVFKQLKQVVRFGLPYNEKKKKIMCTCQLLCNRPNRLYIVECRCFRSVRDLWNSILCTVKVNVSDGVLFVISIINKPSPSEEV